MTHPVYVCIEHKLLMHSARNVGKHCWSKHDMWYGEAEKKGIVALIGDCNPQEYYSRKCPDAHNRTATDNEMEIAQKKETLKDV